MIQIPGLPRPSAPLLLAGAELRALLRPRPLVAAIERALRELDADALALAPTVHLPGQDGGFHLKSAFSRRAPRRAAVKLNGNFPANPERHGLPTIQGILALLDLEHGNVLALMDSPVVTALRTAAVSALAARLLARPEASRLALVGCGVQAREHLELLALDFPLSEARLFDRDRAAAERLARRAVALGLAVAISESASDAIRGADLVVASTSSAMPLLDDADVAPGAFVAAVGADNPTKCEAAPELLARSRVVVDSLASAAANGDLRSALAAGAMREGEVHGELPALVAGRVAGRTDSHQRFVFDSTGLAATDLAAAELAFDAASTDPGVARFDFDGALPGRFERSSS